MQYGSPAGSAALRATQLPEARSGGLYELDGVLALLLQALSSCMGPCALRRDAAWLDSEPQRRLWAQQIIQRCLAS